MLELLRFFFTPSALSASISEAVAGSLTGFCVGYDADVAGARERNALGRRIWEAGSVMGEAVAGAVILDCCSRIVWIEDWI